MTGAASSLLADGAKLHLHHGPIDLVIGADAARSGARGCAFRAAERRFETVLQELADELPLLRAGSAPGAPAPRGPVAQRMAAAVRPHAQHVFITPMAAVAGAVADEILDVMTAAAPLNRAYVNNGGDIALHLAPGFSFSIMLAGLDGADMGRAEISAESPVRGAATSGRGGRSLSLGLADSVTVLARTAAAADAAATLAANAVDLPGHPAVTREKACELDPDSGLGDLPAVVDCGFLHDHEINAALARGHQAAERMRAAGLIESAALFLRRRARIAGKPPQPALNTHQEPYSHAPARRQKNHLHR